MKKRAERSVTISIKDDHLVKVAQRLYVSNRDAWQGLDDAGIRTRLTTLLEALKMPSTDLAALAMAIRDLVRDDAPPSGDERRRQVSRMGGQGLPF